jgi:hypothetical protein
VVRHLATLAGRNHSFGHSPDDLCVAELRVQVCAAVNDLGLRILSKRRPVLLPKKPRELPESLQQDRKGEPKRTDAEDRDLPGGEGGTIGTSMLPSDVSRDD